MKKTFKSYFAIWAILLVLFNIVAFVSVGWAHQEKYTPSFWVGYIFITLAFIGQLACARIAFNAKNLNKLFYNIPLISLSWNGLIISFVIGGLCMLISPLPYWVGVIACSIVFAVVAIAVIKAECKKVYEAVRYSDPMSNDALASIESDITTAFAKLSEAVVDDNFETVSEFTSKIIILLGDRNKKCKLLK